jgi:hypothetical protein
MAVMQPPTGPIEISDPKNVPEVFINGPFNIINMGGMVQITFTTVRPDANDLFAGKSAPKYQGTVICRLLMPGELAQQLVRTRSRTILSRLLSSQRGRLLQRNKIGSLVTGSDSRRFPSPWIVGDLNEGCASSCRRIAQSSALLPSGSAN